MFCIINNNNNKNELLKTYEYVDINMSKRVNIYKDSIEITLNLIENSDYTIEIIYLGTYSNDDIYYNVEINKFKTITTRYDKQVIYEQVKNIPITIRCLATDKLFYISDEEELTAYSIAELYFNEIMHDSVTAIKGTSLESIEDFNLISNYRMDAQNKIDMFIEKDSTVDIKEEVNSCMDRLSKHGISSAFSISDIVSIKVGNEDFNTTTVGIFDVVVTYQSDKTINLKIQVDTKENNILNQNLQSNTIKFDEENYVSKGTELATWIEGKSIKLGYETEYTPLTASMVSGFDTSKEQKILVNITHNNFTQSILLGVYDNKKVDSIVGPMNSLNVEQGDNFDYDLFIIYNNGETSNDSFTSNTSENISGFDNTKTGPQIVTFTIGEITTQLIVYVYNETDNPANAIDNFSNPIEIKDGAIVGQPTFNFIYLDGTSSENINVTLDMIKDLDLSSKKDGYYHFEYTDANKTTFYKSIEVDFIE